MRVLFSRLKPGTVFTDESEEFLKCERVLSEKGSQYNAVSMLNGKPAYFIDMLVDVDLQYLEGIPVKFHELPVGASFNYSKDSGTTLIKLRQVVIEYFTSKITFNTVDTYANRLYTIPPMDEVFIDVLHKEPYVSMKIAD